MVFALIMAATDSALLTTLRIDLPFVFLSNLVWVELLLVLFAFISRDAWSSVSLPRWSDDIVRRAAIFAERPIAPYVAAALLASLPRLLLAPVLPPPDPMVPDEFSHRFLAETLLAGRFANPTHPMWQHFETLHIFHLPTYSSMYLPGIALFLALGKVLAGHFWAGVLLSAAFAAPSILWMLRALLPPRWAALGTLFFILRTCLSSYWIESYWGGFVAAGAGALAIGGVFRLRRSPSALSGAAMGLGVALLAWTRPFEGMILASTCGGMLMWSFASSATLRGSLVRALIPAAVLLAMALTATLSLNRAVTGDPLKLPYAVNRKLYDWPLTLAWFEPRTDVTYRHQALAHYHDFEVSAHEALVNPRFAPFTLMFKILYSAVFYAGPLLLMVLILGLRRPWNIPEGRYCLLLAIGIFAALAVEQSGYPHYIAPAAGLIYLALAASWRALSSEGMRGLLTLVFLFFSTVCISAPLLRAVGIHPNQDATVFISWCDPPGRGIWRAGFVRQLERTPGNHVVVVRYHSKSYKTREWVYNEPDIDASRIVWAQDMGPDTNERLLQYYKGRRVWVAEPYADPPRLTEYTGGSN